MDDDIPFYYGKAENKLNSKGQVAIPARFRSVLTEEDKARNHVIIPGGTDCLYMYTHRQFAKIKDNIKRYAETNNAIQMYRRFMAQAVAVDIDPQGRFVLPASAMKVVGIAGPSILFVGMNDRIEVWEPAVYERVTDGDKPIAVDMNEAVAREVFGI